MGFHNQYMDSIISHPSIRYGWGCFETIKVYPEGRIAFLIEHLERLYTSCSILSIQPLETKKSLLSKITQVVQNNKSNTHQALRITIYKDFPADISISEYSPSIQTIKLITLPQWKIISGSPLNHCKSCQYLTYHLSAQDAKKLNYDQALITNEYNHIVESSTANIFLQDYHHQWYTPSLIDGCLPGIIRQKLIPYLNATDTNIPLNTLKTYKSAIITNSLIDAVSVLQINDTQLNIVPESDLQSIKDYLYLHATSS